MDVPGRPGETNASYWEELAKPKRYDERIFDSSKDDKTGVIRAALDQAALRARGKSASGHRLKVVDLGCGPGKWLPALNDRFDDVKALDISPGLLKQAKRVARQKRLANVNVLQAIDLGKPCEYEKEAPEQTSTRNLCGPVVRGAKDADVVVSMNSLISPDALTRHRMLRRAADMLRPTVDSTLLLVVPSRKSYLRIRGAYHRLGLSKLVGTVVDLEGKRAAEEESRNVFQAGLVPTQFFTRESICDEVEAVGLECAHVSTVPYSWRSALPGLSQSTAHKLRGDAPPHLLMVEAHPKTSSLLGSRRVQNSALGAQNLERKGAAAAASSAEAGHDSRQLQSKAGAAPLPSTLMGTGRRNASKLAQQGADFL